MSELEPEVPQDLLESMERRVRAGLGVEEALVDVLKDGETMRAFTYSDAGKLLIKTSMNRLAGLLADMTGTRILTPDESFRAVLALRCEVCMLRSVTATIVAGSMAEKQMIALEEANQAVDAQD